jgi:ribosomal protein L11
LHRHQYHHTQPPDSSALDAPERVGKLGKRSPLSSRKTFNPGQASPTDSKKLLASKLSTAALPQGELAGGGINPTTVTWAYDSETVGFTSRGKLVPTSSIDIASKMMEHQGDISLGGPPTSVLLEKSISEKRGRVLRFGRSGAEKVMAAEFDHEQCKRSLTLDEEQDEASTAHSKNILASCWRGEHLHSNPTSFALRKKAGPSLRTSNEDMLTRASNLGGAYKGYEKDTGAADDELVTSLFFVN